MTAYESRESSSPMITRAVAAALLRRWGEGYLLNPLQRAGLELLGRLPQRAALAVIPRVAAPGLLDPGQLEGLPVSALAQERLADYEGISGPFSAVTVGVGMGAASAHIALALGGPFLPQAFVLTIAGGSPQAVATEYFQLGQPLARSILQANPGVMTIQHFDPVHDGWLTRKANHIRIKLLDLPEAYAKFLRASLAPGGTVIYLEGGARWLHYRTGERSVFQVGGWGDIPAGEYLAGSPRLAAYQKKAGFRPGGWELEGYPLQEGPESEWGSEPEFAAALGRFCRENGFHYARISFRNPHNFSKLAFRAVRLQMEKGGQQPQGTIIESFSQFDVTAALQGGLLPLWLIFNTRDSAAHLRAMRPEIPKDKPAFFSPLATFSLTPDMASWHDWQQALEGLDWTNIGARRSHYPADPLALLHWNQRLREWVRANPQPVRETLSPDEMIRLAAEIEPQVLDDAGNVSPR